MCPPHDTNTGSDHTLHILPHLGVLPPGRACSKFINVEITAAGLLSAGSDKRAHKHRWREMGGRQTGLNIFTQTKDVETGHESFTSQSQSVTCCSPEVKHPRCSVTTFLHTVRNGTAVETPGKHASLPTWAGLLTASQRHNRGCVISLSSHPTPRED